VSSPEAVTEIDRYLQQSGGKRLRPALLLLAAKSCGYEGPAAVRLGAMVEMIYTSTSLHDDVIDEADRRCARSSTNSCWDNRQSLLAGAWLYTQAFGVAVGERNFRVLDILINLTQMMVEGGVSQHVRLGKIDVTEDEYLELAHRKTGSLFSACMYLGSMLGGPSEAERGRLRAYGANLGLAFQLVDDLLDFTSSQEKPGKPVGNDLRKGKVTLPLIYLLKKCGPEEAAKVARVLEERGSRSVRFEEILDLVRTNGALGAARERAHQFAEQARRCLEGFPDSVYKDALRSLPDLITERGW
jgi:octaprenyl-diphosphate synthase